MSSVLANLTEAKDRLSLDNSDKDSDIENMLSSIESYLYIATGVTAETWASDETGKALAKEYVLFSLYLDYYEKHTELNNLRQTSLMKQLQAHAMVI